VFYIKSVYEEEKRKICKGIPMSETIRSFIAFDMGNGSVLNRITHLQDLLTKIGADLKLVEPKNIHITLRFLGNITTSMAEKVFEEMKKVQFTPFDAGIRGTGAFPNLRYPRVLWVGIAEGADQLRSIFNQLEPRLRGLGFAPDSKGFSPHLTIARVRSGRNKAELAKFLSENSNYEFGIIRAECLKLKRSDLTPKGPIYSTLKEFCPQK
jgi:2'-5' RNA ligase